MTLPICYRPQRSWAKVMFLQASVILSTEGGGCLPQCMLGYHPTPWEHTPPSRNLPLEQTPLWSRHPPPGADTPPGAYPPEQTDTPGTRPPREADASIRSMSGRYASYWNAFLFLYLIPSLPHRL